MPLGRLSYYVVFFLFAEVNKFHFLFLLAVTVACFGQIALKKSALGEKNSLLRQYANPHVVLGYSLMLLSMGMASIAYREVSLRIAQALDSLGFALIPILSHFFFKEKLSALKIVGFFLIASGVLIFVS